MGFFSSLLGKNNLDKPVILKEISDNGKIEKLEKMLSQKEYQNCKSEIENDILKVQSGYSGEKNVGYYLRNSGIPMYIMHDLFLKYDNETKSQIDFIAVTRKMIFVIECKNFSYSQKITVDKNGQFVATQKDNSQICIKNPTEQNRIHMEVIGQIFPKFKKICYPVVVFANPTCELEYDKAPEEISSHMVRADNLVNFINKITRESRLPELSDSKMKEYADCFLEKNSNNTVDYTQKYRKTAPAKPPVEKKKPVAKAPEQEIRCICPNCKKPVPKGYYFCQCGMRFTIYKTKLSDEDIKSLISGKTIKCMTEYDEKIVYPQIEKHEYQGKTFFQWKSAPVPAKK